jgi:hypothetical protein
MRMGSDYRRAAGGLVSEAFDAYAGSVTMTRG